MKAVWEEDRSLLADAVRALVGTALYTASDNYCNEVAPLGPGILEAVAVALLPEDLDIDFESLSKAKAALEQFKGEHRFRNTFQWKQGMFAFNAPIQKAYGRTVDVYTPGFTLPFLSPQLPNGDDSASDESGASSEEEEEEMEDDDESEDEDEEDDE